MGHHRSKRGRLSGRVETREKCMRKLLIVVGPLAGAGFLALPASEDRANAGQNGSQPSFGTESLRTEGERAVGPRDGRSYAPGDTARTT
jgi:hypothetical protein